MSDLARSNDGLPDLALVDGLSAGFDDDVHQAQAGFRTLLEVLSRPGRIETLKHPARPPTGLSPAAATALAVLADLDTPVHLARGPWGREAAAFVTGRCGASLVDEGEAAFVVVPAADLLPLTRFSVGTPAYPDRAATLIVEVEALGTGEAIEIEGPGIAGRATLALTGLPDGFKPAWAAQRVGFPLGVDLLFCCDDRVAGLPRSSAIR